MMAYPDLLSVSSPNTSEKGEVVYRLAAMSPESADRMLDQLPGKYIGSAWKEPLPNTQKVALMWIPASALEKKRLRETFIAEQIKKAVELIQAGTFKVEYQRGAGGNIVAVHNTKTQSICTIAPNGHMRDHRCIVGQRCGICKHLCLAVIRGDILDKEISELWESMDARGELRTY